jgi:hypothetical protein
MFLSVPYWLIMKPDFIVGEEDMMHFEMNCAPQDAEPPTGSVRILPLYRSAIGDAIFLGDDFHTLRMRSDFSEMLLQHLAGGGELNLTAIGASLAEFTPERVSTTTHPAWKDRVAEEWEQCERQRIFAAMEEFFLNGGLERRLEDQCTFFVALQAAGIQFGDTAQLIDRVLHAGDWRETFIQLTTMGRQHGIQLGGNNIDRPRVAAALHSAGFSQEQQDLIWCNLPAPSSREDSGVFGHMTCVNAGDGSKQSWSTGEGTFT